VGGLAETGRVDGNTEGGLDTGTESLGVTCESGQANVNAEYPNESRTLKEVERWEGKEKRKKTNREQQHRRCWPWPWRRRCSASDKRRLSTKERRSEGEERSTNVDVGLGTDLETDSGSGRLRVPDSLGTGLNVLRDLVVVGSGEDGEVGESVKGDGVRRGGVTETEGVAGDGTGGDGVGRLGTEEETVTADNLNKGEGVSEARR
jgi:hypothetical protein